MSGTKFENEYKVESPSDIPKTGDEFTPLLFAVLIVVSMGVIIGLFLNRKRNKKEE